MGGFGALGKKTTPVWLGLGLVAVALAVGGCAPLASSHLKADVASGPWSAHPTVGAVATTSPTKTRVAATPRSTPTQTASATASSTPAQPEVVPSAATTTAQPSLPPLSAAAAQVEHDGYSLIGQTTSNGYPIALGQNQSGDEELVETWGSPLQAQEEFAQYYDADEVLGLIDVSLTPNGDLLIAYGPADEIDEILSHSSFGSNL